MKTHTPNVDPTQRVELTTDLNGSPFVIAGDYEAIMPLYEEAMSQPQPVIARQTNLEAPVDVPKPEPDYLNLAELSGRTAARMALKAYWHDITTLGRTSLYRQFKEKLHEEQDLQAMVDLHIVDSVHCRLHEKQLAKARGLE